MAPLSPYGASKAVGEAYCSAFYGAYGMEAVAVRFSNAYGPRSAHKGNVIPLFIRRLRAGEDLVVFGDGTQTRDFVFVRPTSPTAWSPPPRTPGVGGEVFQLASGVETTPEPAARAARQTSGPTPQVRREPPRAGRDPAQLLAHRQGLETCSATRRRSTWSGACARTWDWFADQ